MHKHICNGCKKEVICTISKNKRDCNAVELIACEECFAKMEEKVKEQRRLKAIHWAN